MEKQEYEDGTLPRHVANFFRAKKEAEITAILDKEERKHMDDDEMRQMEPGQNVGFYNFFK